MMDLLGLLLGVLIVGTLAALLTPTAIGVVWLARRFGAVKPARVRRYEMRFEPGRSRQVRTASRVRVRRGGEHR